MAKRKTYMRHKYREYWIASLVAQHHIQLSPEFQRMQDASAWLAERLDKPIGTLRTSYIRFVREKVS